MKGYALISVSDKTAIEVLAKELTDLGYQIISTGGTSAHLNKHSIPTIQVSDWTGFPECMDGRVKTLHPKVHGGFLAERDNPEHLKQMRELGIQAIDIVCVNLYPFKQTVANPKSTKAEIIENIDIGGPAMVRSAAKNFRFVNILTDPADYPETIRQLREFGKTNEQWRQHLAMKAFEQVADYDEAIEAYFHSLAQKEVDDEGNSILETVAKIKAPLLQTMRYGENPHQKAGFYSSAEQGWIVMHGKPLSYNNLLDLDAALKGIRLFTQPTVMIFKHTNPCGIGSGANLTDAYNKAFQTDTASPFGGIVVTNGSVDIELARKINEVFTEIIIAPDYTAEALAFLEKKKDRRLISYAPDVVWKYRPRYEIKTTVMGYLMQEWDGTIASEVGWQVVTKRQPSEAEYRALRFAWRVTAILKSNAIALTGEDRTFGLGMGQTSRVDSAEIAIEKALRFGHDLSNAVCASDGFFPFRDSVELLAKHGIKAVIQPGGSKGDAEVISACDEFGISMIFTGCRHFRH